MSSRGCPHALGCVTRDAGKHRSTELRAGQAAWDTGEKCSPAPSPFSVAAGAAAASMSLSRGRRRIVGREKGRKENGLGFFRESCGCVLFCSAGSQGWASSPAGRCGAGRSPSPNQPASEGTGGAMAGPAHVFSGPAQQQS